LFPEGEFEVDLAALPVFEADPELLFLADSPPEEATPDIFLRAEELFELLSLISLVKESIFRVRSDNCLSNSLEESILDFFLYISEKHYLEKLNSSICPDSDNASLFSFSTASLSLSIQI
jgi:hypothetical protein